ncbi:MAG: alpha/beta hydrolase, partial [Caulobacteraceae bacterium]|nr:alpha/beta hydrolase [Caulobacter sp.]
MEAPGAPLPRRGAAEWVEGADGACLRAALFRPQGAPRGSVVIHPGRTEFIEKYGEVVGDW